MLFMKCQCCSPPTETFSETFSDRLIALGLICQCSRTHAFFRRSGKSWGEARGRDC